jgi:DNA-binding response OmpR family regulator
MWSRAWRVSTETSLSTPRTQSRVASKKSVLVLLVSSDTGLRDEIQKTLHAHRHTLVWASTAEKARAILRQASPHLLIADLQEDAESLRSHLAPSTGLLSLSDRSQPDAGWTSPSRLTKPVQPDELLAVVRRLRENDGADGSSG